MGYLFIGSIQRIETAQSELRRNLDNINSDIEQKITSKVDSQVTDARQAADSLYQRVQGIEEEFPWIRWFSEGTAPTKSRNVRVILETAVDMSNQRGVTVSSEFLYKKLDERLIGTPEDFLQIGRFCRAHLDDSGLAAGYLGAMAARRSGNHDLWAERLIVLVDLNFVADAKQVARIVRNQLRENFNTIQHLFRFTVSNRSFRNSSLLWLSYSALGLFEAACGNVDKSIRLHALSEGSAWADVARSQSQLIEAQARLLSGDYDHAYRLATTVPADMLSRPIVAMRSRAVFRALGLPEQQIGYDSGDQRPSRDGYKASNRAEVVSPPGRTFNYAEKDDELSPDQVSLSAGDPDLVRTEPPVPTSKKGTSAT